MSDYRISKQGLDEIKKSENLLLKAYQDIGGVWTIGYGHTGKVRGKAIGPGMTITKEEAEQILADDVMHFENAVRRNVKVPLNQNQYDALVNLSFNIGDGAFKDSTLLRRLNQGDYQAAADQILVWNKVGGKLSKGLANRRERERSMFLGQGEQLNQGDNLSTPVNIDGLIGDPIQPQQNSNEWLNAFSSPTEEPQLNPYQPLADNIEQIKNSFEQIEPFSAAIPEQPKPNNRVKYQKELANAFGIEPSTKDLIPDHIGDLVRSIYDKTT